ncbi:hypothetical protein ACTFIW_003180 [Dictyostelium discoideum]
MGKNLIELGDLTDKNLGQLVLLNNTTLPVSYEEKFYSKLLSTGFVSKLAFFNDIMVGAVCCRIDQSQVQGEQPSLYIMTFCVLAQYRNLGIGRKLLEYIEELCKTEKYEKISLHVQVGSDAIDFYKKFSFSIESTINNYYRNIQPADCYVMSKKMITSDEKKDDNTKQE